MLSGAAGAGKSSACRQLARRVDGVCALDGDTLASAKRPWDYDEYWAFTMRICSEILGNGLVPVICGIGLPSQVFPAADEVGLSVDMLALVCDPEEIRRRVVDRGYGQAWRDPDKHVAIDEAIRATVAPPPHKFATFDSGTHGPNETAAAAIAWAEAATARILSRAR